MTEPIRWGTNAPISLPEPPQHDILIDMESFGFTEFGMNFNLSMADIEDYHPDFVGDNDS